MPHLLDAAAREVSEPRDCGCHRCGAWRYHQIMQGGVVLCVPCWNDVTGQKREEIPQPTDMAGVAH